MVLGPGLRSLGRSVSQEAVQRANASAAALLEAKSTGADLARQLKAAEERQMESEEKVKAPRGL